MIMKDYQCIDGNELLEHLEQSELYEYYCNPAPDGCTLYIEKIDVEEMYEETNDDYFIDLLNKMEEGIKYVVVMY